MGLCCAALTTVPGAISFQGWRVGATTRLCVRLAMSVLLWLPPSPGRLKDVARASLRPRLDTSEDGEPPLDPLAKAVVGGRTSLEQHLKRKGTLQVPTMRDELLLRLWDALFLTACEHWSAQGKEKGKSFLVTNTTPKDTLEFGWYFWRGEEAKVSVTKYRFL